MNATPSRIAPRRLGWRSFVRFRRAREGVTAIEFAIVAPVFFALLVAIFETSFALLSNQLLETAVIDSSRLILTGQAQNQKMDAATFKSEVCGRLVFLDCEGSVWVGAQKLGNFTTNVAVPVDNAGSFDPTKIPAFDAGGPDDIVMVRLYYKWHGIIASVAKNFGLDFSNQPDGSTLMVATMVIRNEPYQ